MEGKFKPGEKVLIAGNECIIMSRHRNKRYVWFVRTLKGKSGIFDESDITKIEKPKPMMLSAKKQAHIRNAENKWKNPKQATRRDFLMLEE